ncbi:hypothetical protein [Actinomadura coerulea]|uniref:hypothetical protein n=1 Tax=Actinomadura coerulea TaxID=46159 RepID=UPI0034139F3A
MVTVARLVPDASASAVTVAPSGAAFSASHTALAAPVGRSSAVPFVGAVVVVSAVAVMLVFAIVFAS